MKTKTFLLFLIVTMSFSAWSYEVIAVRGEAHFNKSPLKVGQVLVAKGLLETEARSFVRLKIDEQGNEMVLGGSSSAEIDPSSTYKVELGQGSLRWMRTVHDRLRTQVQQESGPQLRTTNVALGIRGTNFLLQVNSLLGETEIVVFEGKVNFQNRSEPSDQVEITKGQWGGLGGRFGAQVVTPIDLPDNALQHFDRYLRF